ncbi:hypothetical protein B0H13DRAFT_2371264 [Mycena leptocephala]|nr:hypothetical protein B0H13DRAFT_2371264 [Mycena leptocephala]
MSIWLRWAVDPASALRVLLLPPLLALPTHFLLPLLRPYLSLPLQGVGNPFTPFFLLSHSTAAPDRLSAAVLKVPGDLALLTYSVVLFSFLRLVLSHSLFPALARRWGIRKPGKVVQFGEQGPPILHACHSPSLFLSSLPRPPLPSPPLPFPPLTLPPRLLTLTLPSSLGSLSRSPFFWLPAPIILLTRSMYTLSTTPASSTFKPRTPHFWLDRRWCVSSSDFRLPSMFAVFIFGESRWRVFGLCIDGGALVFPAAPHSFLQPRGLLFSAYTRACIDSVLARAWNADAKSVRAVSPSPTKSRFVPEFGLPIRAARSRCTFGPPIRYGIADPAIPLEFGVTANPNRRDLRVGVAYLYRASNYTNTATRAPT